MGRERTWMIQSEVMTLTSGPLHLVSTGTVSVSSCEGLKGGGSCKGQVRDAIQMNVKDQRVQVMRHSDRRGATDRPEGFSDESIHFITVLMVRYLRFLTTISISVQAQVGSLT